MQTDYNATVWFDHTGNSSNTTDTPESLDVIPKSVRIIVIFTVSVAVILTNILNLIVLRKTRQIPPIAKTCVLNLSVADLTSGLVCMLPCVACAVTGTWPYGIVWCQIAGVCHGTCCAMSIWSLTLVSVDRYLAIKLPLRYHNLMTPRKCVTILLCLWCLGYGTFLLPILISENWIYYNFDAANLMCGLYWGFKWLCIVTGVYIPLASGFIIAYTTVALAKETGMLSSRVGPVNLEQSDNKVDTKAIKILGITAMVYFTAWGPYVASVYAASFASHVHIPPGVQFSVLWLANSNSFMNVFIYSMIYRSFRIQAKSIVMSLLCFRLSTLRADVQSETG